MNTPFEQTYVFVFSESDHLAFYEEKARCLKEAIIKYTENTDGKTVAYIIGKALKAFDDSDFDGMIKLYNMATRYTDIKRVYTIDKEFYNTEGKK